MRPARALVGHAPGAEAVALAHSGEAYAVYLTGAGGSYLLLDAPPGRCRTAWMRPADAASAGQQDIEHKNGLLRLQTPAFDGDMALKLVRIR